MAILEVRSHLTPRKLERKYTKYELAQLYLALLDERDRLQIQYELLLEERDHLREKFDT